MHSKVDVTKCSGNTNKQHEILALANTRIRPIPCTHPILSAAAIPIPIPGCTNFFVPKMRFGARYRCVQVIYVCGVYVRKYGIGLKL